MADPKELIRRQRALAVFGDGVLDPEDLEEKLPDTGLAGVGAGWRSGDIGDERRGPGGDSSEAFAMVGTQPAPRSTPRPPPSISAWPTGEMAHPVADGLLARHILFVLTSGYDASSLPHRYAHVALCETGMDFAFVKRALVRAVITG